MHTGAYETGPGEARTPNLRVRSATLYPIELQVHIMVPPPGAAPGYRNFQFRVSTAITKVAYWYQQRDLNPSILHVKQAQLPLCYAGTFIIWWTYLGSNQAPLECKSSALPNEL